MKIIPFKQLMKEAIVVGVFLVILFFIVHYVAMKMYGDKKKKYLSSRDGVVATKKLIEKYL